MSKPEFNKEQNAIENTPIKMVFPAQFRHGKNQDILINAVEKYRDLILDAERYIWANPETGYKEFKTSAYLSGKFEELGYKLTYAEI